MDRRSFLKSAGLFVLATACTDSASDVGRPATSTTAHTGHVGSSTTTPLAESTDILRISKSTVIDKSMRVAGLVIEPGATLTFAPDADIAFESTGNIVVLGTLSAHPREGVTHSVRFVGVDESKLVGGGMDVLETDVGVWVMEGGRLDLIGAPKTAWAYEAAQDWAPTDEVVVVPTAPGDFEGFVHTTAADLGGLIPDKVAGRWAAEILNLTRNLRIEGAAGGRSHVFIRSTSPQTIRFVSLSQMGPSEVLGRYPVHFHHSLEGSRGSVVEGVVTRDCGRHAFVPHMSDGITFTDCIAYDTIEDPYWWDEGDATNDLVFERCVAALVRIGSKQHRLSGFFLGDGENNVIRDCAAVGVLGGEGTGGFSWPSSVRVGSWDFHDNVSHNNEGNGLWVWQNQHDSTVASFVAYHNGVFGISHGAYNNSFVYRDGIVYGNGRASVRFTALGATFANLVLDGAGHTEVGVLTGRHPAYGKSSTVFENCSIVEHTGPKVMLEEGQQNRFAGSYEFIDCDLAAADVEISGTLAEGTTLLAQDDGKAFKLDAAGNVESIPPFAGSTGGGPTY
ncbi:MAG TPA: hypothetical protein VJQ79_00045 [Acidimicrobiia bacterium]|nr:hypothetical protein [Acidimicrobiia bacterium]